MKVHWAMLADEAKETDGILTSKGLGTDRLTFSSFPARLTVDFFLVVHLMFEPHEIHPQFTLVVSMTEPNGARKDIAEFPQAGERGSGLSGDWRSWGWNQQVHDLRGSGRGRM
jgi:hypothetical protein